MGLAGSHVEKQLEGAMYDWIKLKFGNIGIDAASPWNLLFGVCRSWIWCEIVNEILDWRANASASASSQSIMWHYDCEMEFRSI